MILDHLTDCEVLSTVSQEQDEQQWLANRLKGIGGSDIGAICGVNKYSSARIVYLTKTGQHEVEFSDRSKENMEWGRRLEPVVAAAFEEKTGKKVIISPATLRHKQFPWALANVDRFIVDEQGVPYGILECKTADKLMLDDWDEGDLPMSYIYQLNWYLFITGLKYGAFACLVGGNRFYYYEIYRNDELIESTIFPKAAHFWNYNVKNMIEPEISGSEADSELLGSKYKQVDKNSEITLMEEELDTLAAFIMMGKAQLKELEAKVDEAINKFKDQLKEKEIAYTTGHIIKWSPRSQQRVDTDLLRTEYPHIWEKCKKTINYRVFTVKQGELI